MNKIWPPLSLISEKMPSKIQGKSLQKRYLWPLTSGWPKRPLLPHPQVNIWPLSVRAVLWIPPHDSRMTHCQLWWEHPGSHAQASLCTRLPMRTPLFPMCKRGCVHGVPLVSRLYLRSAPQTSIHSGWQVPVLFVSPVAQGTVFATSNRIQLSTSIVIYWCLPGYQDPKTSIWEWYWR